MDAKETHERTAEELEREESAPPRPAERGPGLLERIEREAAPLQEGEAIASRLGPLPVRSLAAIGAFVAIAVVVYLLCWSLFGTLGLLVGWIPAVALGLLVAREIGLRAARDPVRVNPAPR
jgi:hypothetical protein